MSISMKRYNDTIITPKDDRILFDQIFDDYGLIYGGSATMAASNKIHVGAARGFIKGTEVIVEAEDIAVNLSDSGTKNGRLKIVMDLADTETPIKFESEVAASFPALEQDANINYDNGRYEVVFATYKATETTISSVALVMPTMQSVKAKIQGINQSLTQLNEGIFKEPIQINYIYNYTSAMQKVLEYECEETGIYVINVSGDDFFTHCFITDERYAAQIAAMSNNGVATKIQCTNQYKMYKGHKYKIELWNATFQMYKY